MTPEGKGWGLRTLEDLPKGAFICEYVGEIVTNTELDERNKLSTGKKHTYPVLLDADWGSEGVLKDEEALCLDATVYGNVARFINHRYNSIQVMLILHIVSGLLELHCFSVIILSSNIVPLTNLLGYMLARFLFFHLNYFQKCFVCLVERKSVHHGQISEEFFRELLSCHTSRKFGFPCNFYLNRNFHRLDAKMLPWLRFQLKLKHQTITITM